MASPQRALDRQLTWVSLVATALLALTMTGWRGSWAWLGLLGVAAAVRLVPAHHRARAGFSVFLFASVLAAADLTLTGLGKDDLAVRAVQIERTAEWVREGDTRVVADPCLVYRFQEGDDLDHGPPRDARGWRVFQVPGDDPLVVLVIGDSVFYAGMAPILHLAFEAAGIPARIVDTSIYGYALPDYACLLDEGIADEHPDLTLVGVVHNDLPVPGNAVIATAQGEVEVQTVSFLEEELATARVPPMLLESANPWVAARRQDLIDRWGDRITFDLTGAHLVDPLVARMLDPRNGQRAALDDVMARLQAAPGQRAMLVFPLAYHPEPNPVDPLVDAFLSLTAGADFPVIDLRPILRPFPVEDLSLTGGHVSALIEGHGPLDLLHYNPIGLALAAEATLRSLTDPALTQRLQPVRAALIALALDGMPCGGWSCTPGPPSAPANGVVRPPSACEATGVRDCAAQRKIGVAGVGFRNGPTGAMVQPDLPPERAEDRNLELETACAPVVATLMAAHGEAWVDALGDSLQADDGPAPEVLIEVCHGLQGADAAQVEVALGRLVALPPNR